MSHFVVHFGPALTLAAVAVAAAVFVLWTRLMTACQTSVRGDCCDGRDGCGVVRAGGRVCESGRTEVWSWDTGVCPGLVDWVWCRSSWGSSWGLPLAAVGWQTPAETK